MEEGVWLWTQLICIWKLNLSRGFGAFGENFGNLFLEVLMKEKELREKAVCSVCLKKIGQSGLPLFWTLKIERHGIDMGAVQRKTGLAHMLGGHAILASAMGPNEEMTKPLMAPVCVVVCETCSMKQICIAALADQS
jgi:hypothetical protein